MTWEELGRLISLLTAEELKQKILFKKNNGDTEPVRGLFQNPGKQSVENSPEITVGHVLLHNYW